MTGSQSRLFVTSLRPLVGPPPPPPPAPFPLL